MAAIIAAVRAGETVEVRADNEPWSDLYPDCFVGNFVGAEYRLKPKPAEVWMEPTINGWRKSHPCERGAKLFRQVM